MNNDIPYHCKSIRRKLLLLLTTADFTYQEHEQIESIIADVQFIESSLTNVQGKPLTNVQDTADGRKNEE